MATATMLPMRATPTDVARWTPIVRVRGRSMLPTLAPGQILLTRPPRAGVCVGDVVVLTTAHGARYVKRVAAGPGDVVALEAGHLSVNACPSNGQARARAARAKAWQVPDGHYFVVGDNLRESNDSRIWAQPFVAASRISGVVLRRWPWRRVASATVMLPVADFR